MLLLYLLSAVEGSHLSHINIKDVLEVLFFGFGFTPSFRDAPKVVVRLPRTKACPKLQEEGASLL